MPKHELKGDLGIPKPKKMTKGPDLDFSNDLQTDYFTLDDLEKTTIQIKSLKDGIKTKKIK